MKKVCTHKNFGSDKELFYSLFFNNELIILLHIFIHSITAHRTVSLLDEGIFGATGLADDALIKSIDNRDADSSVMQLSEMLSAPLEVCTWNELCVFANEIIETLNNTRHALSVQHVRNFNFNFVL